jgi:hypothetical protein
LSHRQREHEQDERETALELLQIEQADAWFEYSEKTRHLRGKKYEEIEPWAWAYLLQRLRDINFPRTKPL